MDTTVVNPGTPKYDVNDTVYIKASAQKGFIEPLVVESIAFDNRSRNFRYSFIYAGVKYPITLLECELITLCEAYTLKIAILTEKLEKAQVRFAKNCGSGLPQRQRSQLPIVTQPLFGVNEIVYLTDSALNQGELDAMRVDSVRLVDGGWIYKFNFIPRPEANSTVGDMYNLKSRASPEYSESELCSYCEAENYAVQYLIQALAQATAAKEELCNEISA